LKDVDRVQSSRGKYKPRGEVSNPSVGNIMACEEQADNNLYILRLSFGIVI
jgi:hypothetical protein